MALEALVEPCPTPPALSTTTTRCPSRASSRAIAEPITPAPITTTSTRRSVMTASNPTSVARPTRCPRSAGDAADQCAQIGECLRVDPVVDPHAALLAVQETRVVQHLEA